jgi:hypothetical protein
MSQQPFQPPSPADIPRQGERQFKGMLSARLPEGTMYISLMPAKSEGDAIAEASKRPEVQPLAHEIVGRLQGIWLVAHYPETAEEPTTRVTL